MDCANMVSEVWMELYGSFGEVKSSAVFLREERFPMGTGVLAGIQCHVGIMSA